MNRSDSITVKNVEIFAHHGVYESERINGQRFLFTVTFFTDLEKAGESDDIADTVHYGEAACKIAEFLTKNTFSLLEAAVTATAGYILKEYPGLSGIELELCKPDAPIDLNFENVSVKRSIFWHEAYIGLGSNIGDKKTYLDTAVRRIKEAGAQKYIFRKTECSEWITTQPYGKTDQEEFLNGVIFLETLLSPTGLFDFLQKLEHESGREERHEFWGPRTLDLDILFYDDLVIDEKRLTIPHPDLHNREFVLRSLNELNPRLRHPLLGKSVYEMLKELRRD